MFIALKTFLDGIEGLFGQANAFLVDPIQQSDRRFETFPCHGARPLAGRVDGIEQGAVPVPLQDSPATLDRIVFAVIWRVVDQDDLQTCLLGKLDHPCHKLRTPALDLGAIVEVDDQLGDVSVTVLVVLPPVLQAVDDEIAGLARGSEEDGQPTGHDIENAEGNELVFRFEVMIGGFHRPGASRKPTPGEWTDLDLRLGVNGNPKGIRASIGFFVLFVNRFEDGVGFFNALDGFFFWTRLKRSPRRLRITPMVFA